jgi:hypothetical protein
MATYPGNDSAALRQDWGVGKFTREAAAIGAN